MERKEIILDRILLAADVLQNAPRLQEVLLQTFDEKELESLQVLLDKLTDEIEYIFTSGSEHAPRKPDNAIEVFENGFVCPDCEVKCRIIREEDGTFTGCRCKEGMKYTSMVFGG